MINLFKLKDRPEKQKFNADLQSLTFETLTLDSRMKENDIIRKNDNISPFS